MGSRSTCLPRLPIVGFAATIALLLGGCDVDTEQITLRPVSFAELPGWAEDDQAAAFGALLKSCRKTQSPDAACAAALALGDGVSRETARDFFEANYTPNVVEGSDTPGLVTAYYEPEVKGSRERERRVPGAGLWQASRSHHHHPGDRARTLQ